MLMSITCQRVTSSSYFTTTSCDNRLIIENDMIVFQSIVNNSRFQNKSVILNYYIKRYSETHFQLYCYLVIPEECDGNHNYYCFCKSFNESGIYEAYINMTANVTNSQALVKGELIFKEMPLHSEIQTLPKIYDQHSDIISIYINDRPIDVKYCKLTTNESSVIVIATCLSGYPCRIELFDAEFNKSLKRGFGIISYLQSSEIVGQMYIAIRYEICQVLTTVYCTIRNGNRCLVCSHYYSN